MKVMDGVIIFIVLWKNNRFYDDLHRTIISHTGHLNIPEYIHQDPCIIPSEINEKKKNTSSHN